MPETHQPRPRRGAVGFQTADLIEFGRSLHAFSGVTQVWFLAPYADRSAAMWVLVKGFDADAFQSRLAVSEAIERFIQDHGVTDSEYAFTYYVVIDEDGLGSPQIPAGAEPIAA
jgi:hypothetical protein